MRQPEPGLVHHSDRGCQYASELYRAELSARGIVCSMSRVGDCWDNAVAESFFATLKTELIHRRAVLGNGAIPSSPIVSNLRNAVRAPPP